jgi:chemotaxis receptor (MCP) glutamine deamidase CheD
MLTSQDRLTIVIAPAALGFWMSWTMTSVTKKIAGLVHDLILKAEQAKKAAKKSCNYSMN